MDHQDWKEVVFKKKQPDSVTSKPQSKASTETLSTSSSKPAWKIERDVDGDSGKPLAFVSKEDGQKIIAGRVAKKLRQKDLAMRLNMQPKEIQDIESGKAVENKIVLSRIKRFLGVL